MFFIGFTFEICFFSHSFLRTSFLPFVLTTGTLDAARSIETQIVPRRIQYKTQLPSHCHDQVDGSCPRHKGREGLAKTEKRIIRFTDQYEARARARPHLQIPYSDQGVLFGAAVDARARALYLSKLI